MRNPNRINGTIETIRRVWHLVPDWRLGQLICNLARDGGAWDSFYMEDDTIEAIARAWLKQNEEQHGDVCNIMVNRKTYSTFQEAVDNAVKLCDGQNFEIRSNSDHTYDLIWETIEDGDKQ